MFRSHQIFMTVDVKTITVARNIPRFAVLLLIIVSHVSFVKAFFFLRHVPMGAVTPPRFMERVVLAGAALRGVGGVVQREHIA